MAYNKQERKEQIMSLDLRNFVNININVNAEIVSTASRGIVTLITKNTAFGQNPLKDKILYSYSDYEKALKTASIVSTALDLYVKAFFGNGGKGLQIIGGYNPNQATVVSFLSAAMQGLAYGYVLIVSDADEQELRKAAMISATTRVAQNPITGEGTVPTLQGLNEKFIISSTTDRSGKCFNSLEEPTAFVTNTYYSFNSENGQYVVLTEAPTDWAQNYASYYSVAELTLDNYLIKVGDKGIEMLAAAYLSKARISDAASVQDYAFTPENVTDFFTQASVIIDNDTGVDLINAHFNFDTRLVNAIRNYPGDTVTGLDAMNYYVKILLTQDLTEAIMNLLASKIRFDQTGLNRLSNAISQAMNAYITNGYLNTDYIWTGDDLYYSFNGQDYLICSRNTPLVKGYKCVILPLDSLTAAQRENHALPPVYMLFADQTGARAVVVNGDIY